MNEKFKKGVQLALLVDVTREYFLRNTREGRRPSLEKIRDGIASQLTLVAPADARDILVEHGLSSCLADGKPCPMVEFSTALNKIRQMCMFANLQSFVHPHRLLSHEGVRYTSWIDHAHVARGGVARKIANLASGHTGVWGGGSLGKLLFLDTDLDLVSDFVLSSLGLAGEVESRPVAVTPDWVSEAHQLMERWGDPLPCAVSGQVLSLQNHAGEIVAGVAPHGHEEGQFRLLSGGALVTKGSLERTLRCAVNTYETADERRRRVRRAFDPLRASAALGSIGLRDRLYERWCEVGLENFEGQVSMWSVLKALYPDHAIECMSLKLLVEYVLGASPNANYPCTTRKMPSYEVTAAKWEVRPLDGKLPLGSGQLGFTPVKSREGSPEDAIVFHAAPQDLKPFKIVERPAQHQRPEVCDWYWVDVKGGKRLAQVEASADPKAPAHALVKWHVGGEPELVSWSRLTTRALAPVPYGETKAFGKDLPYDEVDP